MEKGLCIGSMIDAGLLLVMFLLDIIIGLPFNRAGASPNPFMLVDIGGIIGGGIIGYLGFNALKDLK